MRKKTIKNKLAANDLFLIIFICLLKVINSAILAGSLLLISYTIQAAANNTESINILYGLILDPNNYSIPIWLVFLYTLICFTIVGIILSIALTYLQALIVAKIKFYVESHITKYISYLEYSKKVSTHDNWLSWYTYDSGQIANKGMLYFLNLFSIFTKIIFSLISFGLLHWILFIVCFVLTIVGILIPILFKKYIEKNYEKASKAYEDLIAGSTSILKLYNTVYFWNAFTFFNKLLRKESKKVQTEVTKSIFNIYKVYILGSVSFNYISTAIVWITAILMLLLMNVNLAIFIGATSISTSLFSDLFSFSQTFSEFLGGRKIWHKFSMKSSRKLKPINAFEKIKVNLSEIKYEDKTIKNKINLEIFNSKKILIIGPSGSGKSSLLKLITGELNSYSGLLAANNINYENLDFASLHQWMWQIGAGNYHIFKGASLKDNITLFDQNADESLLNYALDQAQADLLKNRIEEKIGFDDKIPYSEGQLQQIEFARFFYHHKQKKLLLIDESLANIDVNRRSKIQENLLKNPNFALLEVSHHFDATLKNQFNEIINFESENN